MNPTEQRNHKKVTDELASSIDEFSAATVSRFEGVDLALGRERTLTLRDAKEQRAYVDAEDARLRREFASFYNRTFWERLRWLFRGN